MGEGFHRLSVEEGNKRPFAEATSICITSCHKQITLWKMILDLYKHLERVCIYIVYTVAPRTIKSWLDMKKEFLCRFFDDDTKILVTLSLQINKEKMK